MNPATSPKKDHCRECGAEYTARRSGRFCSPACNSKFQNRRNSRGALLYDLWMTNRHERSLAKELQVLHFMTRLAMYWYQQDKGRKTWIDARKTVEHVAWANATVVVNGGPLTRR